MAVLRIGDEALGRDGPSGLAEPQDQARQVACPDDPQLVVTGPDRAVGLDPVGDPALVALLDVLVVLTSLHAARDRLPHELLIAPFNRFLDAVVPGGFAVV